MACPFFYPTGLLGAIAGPYPVPMGDLQRGICQIDASSPEESTQSELCNMGYARTRCARFREGSPDAVRFALVRESDRLLTLAYAVEKNYSPHAIGELRYSRAAGAIEDSADPVLRRQAEAYAASYLRRKQF